MYAHETYVDMMKSMSASLVTNHANMEVRGCMSTCTFALCVFMDVCVSHCFSSSEMRETGRLECWNTIDTTTRYTWVSEYICVFA